MSARASDAGSEKRLNDGLLVPTVIVLILAFIAGVVCGSFWTRKDHRALELDHPVPSALPQGITTFHDAERYVTCWRSDNGGMACLPDDVVEIGAGRWELQP